MSTKTAKVIHDTLNSRVDAVKKKNGPEAGQYFDVPLALWMGCKTQEE